MLKTIACFLFFSVSSLATPRDLAERVINNLIEKKLIKKADRAIKHQDFFRVTITTAYFDAEFNELNENNQIKDFLTILNELRDLYLTMNDKPFDINFDWKPKEVQYFKDYGELKSHVQDAHYDQKSGCDPGFSPSDNSKHREL